MKTNKEILAKELELIFYAPETGMCPMNWKGIATSLLSKLQTLDRKEVKKIIGKYTKPDMLQWTHQIDKTKPVASCFYSKEDYKNCINDICRLIPEEGVVIAEGELDNVKWESPYNKLVFYFKGLPKMIGIKIIKSRKVKIILREL